MLTPVQVDDVTVHHSRYAESATAHTESDVVIPLSDVLAWAADPVGADNTYNTVSYPDDAVVLDCARRVVDGSDERLQLDAWVTDTLVLLRVVAQIHGPGALAEQLRRAAVVWGALDPCDDTLPDNTC